jgi:hypothetical protein
MREYAERKHALKYLWCEINIYLYNLIKKLDDLD